MVSNGGYQGNERQQVGSPRWIGLLAFLPRLAEWQACRLGPWQPARPLSSISTLLYTQHSCSSGGEDLSELLQHL